MPDIIVRPVGVVRSPLTDPRDAPRQPDEGAPASRIELTPEAAALDGTPVLDIKPVLTDLARR